MQNLSVSQAQKQFTSILSKATVIIDKKSHIKKAVILPYETYQRLIALTKKKPNVDINSFVGILSNDFSTEDQCYNSIMNSQLEGDLK